MMHFPRATALLCALALVVLARPVDAADKLTLLLDWFVNPDHGPIVVAERKG